MTLFQLLSLVLVVAALFSYLNYRLFQLPPTIGVMVVALIASLGLLVAGRFFTGLPQAAGIILNSIDFNQTVLHGMLPFLLFAAALQVDLGKLNDEKGAVFVLSTVGVIVSTAIVGALTMLMLHFLAPGVSPVYCFLFGALISPTDPVAVIAIVRKAGAPSSLETQIAGESLFNDGFGVVIFLSILELIRLDGDTSPSAMIALFGVEAIGAVILGLALGLIGYLMLRRVNNYQVETLITIALAMGGYSLAEELHTSAPIAIVVAGLFIGNPGRAFAMSAETRHHLDLFWELIDELLNVVLFSLIGLELLVVPHNKHYLLASAGAVLIVLLGRWGSVAGAIKVMRRYRPFPPGVVTILTWGGLRGGISVALALSLPVREGSNDRELILAITYGVVVFSIIAQGLTVAPIVRHFARKTAEPPMNTDEHG